jgi:hypothetical protein
MRNIALVGAALAMVAVARVHAAGATACNTSVTLNTNGNNTAGYGQNVASSLNYPCPAPFDATGKIRDPNVAAVADANLLVLPMSTSSAAFVLTSHVIFLAAGNNSYLATSNNEISQ